MFKRNGARNIEGYTIDEGLITQKRDTFDSPVDELAYLFDRLTYVIETTRRHDFLLRVKQIERKGSEERKNEKDRPSILTVASERGVYDSTRPGATKIGRLFRRGRKSGGGANDDDIGDSISSIQSAQTLPDLGSPKFTRAGRKTSTESNDMAQILERIDSNIENNEETKAKCLNANENESVFVHINNQDEEEYIEILRRIAELVVVGERVVAKVEKKQEKRKKFERKLAWGDEITEEKFADKIDNSIWEDDEPGTEKYLSIFETFFERNGLALLVDLVTGVSFSTQDLEEQYRLEQQQQPTFASIPMDDFSEMSINEKTRRGLFKAGWLGGTNISGIEAVTAAAASSKAEGSGESKMEKNPQDSNTNTIDKQTKKNSTPVESAQKNVKEDTVAQETETKKVDKDEVDDATNAATSSMDETKSQNQESNKVEDIYFKTTTRLPAMRIATQAMQSVSILVQNVSRATSLYFILSNNHVNSLIDFPLELYSVAEMDRLGHNNSKSSSSSTNNINNSNTPSQANKSSTAKATSRSPELAELTTHFVTFLKSLAMRMNAETLQFFLKYPNPVEPGADVSGSSNQPDQQEQGSSSTDRQQQNPNPTQEIIQIEFPLYARALDFCAADYDNMVRVTAINICMNTLNLTTVEASSTDEGEANIELSSPDGALHNAKQLPFRERLAIAQHTCAPTRVERLISPIFTKLATLWSSLEEQFREINNQKFSIPSSNDTTTPMKEKIQSPGGFMKTPPTSAEVKKKKEKQFFNTIRDLGNDIQDQLLQLEDVLKVGLTALNEQIIEMMLATFCYPLLLQPILLYDQRLPSTDDNENETKEKKPSRMPFAAALNRTNSANSSSSVDNRAPIHVSAPAKSALFTLAFVFQNITHRPLLRLLFTALFHPFLPDSSTEIAIAPEACVTTINEFGQTAIRVDKRETNDVEEGPIPPGRTTYPFGSTGDDVQNSSARNGDESPISTPAKTSQSSSSSSSSPNHSSDQSCIFVLCPALANLLLLTEKQIENMIRNWHPNPYRRAILQLLDVPPEMLDLGQLAISAVDVALKTFDVKFVQEILFMGSNETFSDDIPYESSIGHIDFSNCPDLGSDKEDESTDYGSLDIVVAFAKSLIAYSPGPLGIRKLQFDDVAAHVLLTAIWKHQAAIKIVVPLLEQRFKEVSLLFSEIPPRIPTIQNLGAIVHSIFYHFEGNSLLEDFLQLESTAEDPCLYAQVSCENTIDSLCNRAIDIPDSIDSFILHASNDSGNSGALSPGEIAATKIGIVSATSLLKLDAFVSLLVDLYDSECHAIMHIPNPTGGLAFATDGSLIQTSGIYYDIRNKIFSPLSDGMSKLFTDEYSVNKSPSPGALVVLTGLTALPCVCEAKPGNSSDDGDESGGGAKIVAGGITWQSLYLVFSGASMILAEPTGRNTGDGRVVTSAPLSRLVAERDMNPPESSSPARRCLVHYEWFENTPAPGLFTFDDHNHRSREQQNKRKTFVGKIGPFSRVTMLRSSLDVWFENETACENAFRSLHNKITAAKTRRGDEILDRLSQNQL